ncbi:GNAT family N-acetyltransferase [Streptomyces niveus]|uniref:GNAT family N-acetyltransferase n=1 Tax=Streptomyces niveus TaxID=193462 RepID=UPI00365990B9
MSAGARDLPEEGLSLWLTEWKVDPEALWPGRHMVAAIGRTVAGQVDFYVHPDGQAVKVAGLRVHSDFQRRGLASMLMDAVYAAYPTAWITHGLRDKDGVHWWNAYRDPAPERNIHNRPPAEWAAYFDTLEVAGNQAQHAHLNRHYRLDGHRDAVYRYGERLETEAALYRADFRPVTPVRVDPAAQPLHGALRLVLPPALHAYIHDDGQDAAGRAAALLEHVGHGNLPHDADWTTTRQAAFADAHHQELFQNSPSQRPATHVVFTLRPLGAVAKRVVHALATSVVIRHPGDLAVDVAEVSWRQAERPHLTHAAQLSPAVQAAIAPSEKQYASKIYQNRYDETGFLPTTRGTTTPFAGRAAQIRAMAERLIGSRTLRSPSRAQPTDEQTAAPQYQTPRQRPPSPGR